MCKRYTDFFVHSASKTLLFHRAISELGENWGSLGEKKASRTGAERWRRAGNGAPLFFFIPQFFPQLGAIKQALRGLRCIFIAAAQRVGVYAQRDAGIGMAHACGDGHGVNVIRQQYGGMRMPQIVEAYPFKAVGIREAPEPLRRRVMVQLRAVPCGRTARMILAFTEKRKHVNWKSSQRRLRGHLCLWGE